MADLILPHTFKERNWGKLLTEIESRNVIPVIGPELLLADYEGEKLPLYTHLARLLARRLDIEMDKSDFELSDVIYEFAKKPGADLDEPHYEIWEILKKVNVEVPESLKLLAGIGNLDLFITTTFDDLMCRALNEVRFQGSSKALNLTYKKGTNGDDIPDSFTPGSSAIVYHFFGRANALRNYVVTEEDLLEFSHLWQDEDRRPKKLSLLLKEKYILILGCSFENWLSRFFLYSIKSQSLFESRRKLGLIADNSTMNDAGLICFLSRCQTIVYPQGANDFVRELYNRWQEYTSGRPAVREPAGVIADSHKKGSVFISYANEDGEIAEKIREKLEAAGIDVWYDKNKLECGDLFQQKIEKNIQDSCFFMPLISKNVLTAEHRFFRLEWNHALEESRYRPTGTPFIFPVQIDSTSQNAPFIPEEFKKPHWACLSNGFVTDEFVDIIKKNVREIRRNISN